jgi:LPXTG-site transpeptidase (sortase) family protein
MLKKQPTHPIYKLARFIREYGVSLLLLSFGLLLATIAVIQLADRRSATTTAPALPDVLGVITEDSVNPDEVKPDISGFNVPEYLPRRIIMPSLSVSGLIQKVGRNNSDAISVPSNIHYAGWFTESVKPSSSGLSIIVGHVSGRYSDGVFKNITKLQTGDRIQVEYGDLTIKDFEIVDTVSLPESKSAQYLSTKRPNIEQQLNLVTCGGKFDNESGMYEDRVIVVTKLVR